MRGCRNACELHQHPRDTKLRSRCSRLCHSYFVEHIISRVLPLAAVSEEKMIVKNSRQIRSCSDDNTRVRRLGLFGSPMSCPLASSPDRDPAFSLQLFLWLLHTTAAQVYAQSRACLINFNICSPGNVHPVSRPMRAES
jgi:hypothetical protein